MADLELTMLANVKDVQRGAKDVEASLEQVADSLDDVAKDGDKATERLEASFKELADSAKRESKKAGDSIKDNVRRGTKDAGRGLDDFKDESKQTAREVAANFDGSAQSIAGGFQELAANAFIGFGPAAVAGGLAAAAGLGIISTALGEQVAAADEVKTALTDAYQQAAEEGRNFLTEAQIIAAATETLFDEGKRNNARDEAAKLGVDMLTYIRAQAGDQGALNQVIAAGNQALTDRGATEAILDKTRSAAQQQEVQSIKNILTENEKLAETHEKNQEAAKLSAELRAESAQHERDEIKQTADTLDKLREKAATPIPISIDTSAADKQLTDFLNQRRRVVDIGLQFRHGKEVP